MRIETTRFEIATEDGVSIVDLTGDVAAFVRGTGVRDGLCVMMVGRDECFLSLAPDLDEAFDDLMRLVREAAAPSLLSSHGLDPASDRADIDTTGHVPPGMLAETLSFAVRDGVPEMGSWEAILLVDGEGPSRRAVDVTVMGREHASART